MIISANKCLRLTVFIRALKKKIWKKISASYTHCSSHSFTPPAPVDVTFPDSSCPLTCRLPAEWVESLWPHRSSIPTIPLFRLSDQSHYLLCNWILMPPLHCFLHWWTADVTSLRLPPLRLLFGRMKEHLGGGGADVEIIVILDISAFRIGSVWPPTLEILMAKSKY